VGGDPDDQQREEREPPGYTPPFLSGDVRHGGFSVQQLGDHPGLYRREHGLM
jgi:hypothetical protein